MSKATTIKNTTNTISTLSLKELKIKLQELDEQVVKELESALNTKDFHIELRDTTSCILFVRDKNNNVVFNVYDNFRLQFTTQQVKKYSESLLKNDRFYSFKYKQKDFISAKSKDVNDFIELCKFAYTVVLSNQTTTKQTVTKQSKAQTA